MKFFEKHFNKHHLIRAPHKWFLAFLLSPIHAGQVHYHKKYHLQYRHAKKLFIFDMLLLLSTVVLVGLTILIKTYDPTITADVFVEISTDNERIKSGEPVTFDIEYRNDSSYILTDTHLAVTLPSGFIFDSVEPADIFNEKTNTFNAGTLQPGASSKVQLQGILFAEPDQTNIVSSRITYTSEKTQKTEGKAVHFELTPRGSTLELSIDSSENALVGVQTPVTLELTNTGEFTIENISIPLTFSEGSLQKSTTENGTISDSIWSIDSLEPDETYILKGQFTPTNNQKQSISIAPIVTVGSSNIRQSTDTHSYTILQPSLQTTAEWQTETAAPGEIPEMKITIYNNGDIDLQNLILSIPLTNTIVNTNSFAQKNNAKIINGSTQIPLQNISPKQTQTITLQIPISQNPRVEKDAVFSLPITVRGTIPNIKETYSSTDSSNTIKIGTQLYLSGESRYYTNEGDQLGRGSLPPRVGKETKYWVFITANNNSSNVGDISFRARIPNGITWTGKTSVSFGNDIQYNPSTRTVSWQGSGLAPFTRLGLYMELAFVPTSNQIGTIPTLLENISISGTDRYIGREITRSIPNIKADLKNDQKALQKGIFVE